MNDNEIDFYMECSRCYTNKTNSRLSPCTFFFVNPQHQANKDTGLNNHRLYLYIGSQQELEIVNGL